MLRRHFTTNSNTNSSEYYFSVSEILKVVFSTGNLQYTQSTDTWQFANLQYEYIGAENIKDNAWADKTDLFGWSGTSRRNFGVSSSTSKQSYTGSFLDWGTKTISGYDPGTWRTLSKDEWEYLFTKRNNASNLCGVAQVAGINGVIILPDNWVCPAGIVFKIGFSSGNTAEHYYSNHQSFDNDEWELLETCGAIFLPACGAKSTSSLTITGINLSGRYWTSKSTGTYTANYMAVNAAAVQILSAERQYHYAIRLVKNV